MTSEIENIQELKRRLERAEALVATLRGAEVEAVMRLDGADLLRRRAQEEDLLKTTDPTAAILLDSAVRLKRAMAAGRIFSFEWDVESDTVWRSEGSAAILGFATEASIRDNGANHFRHIYGDDRPGFLQILRSLTPDAPDYDKTYRFVRDDGRIVWLEESGRAEFGANGEIARIQGIVSDATGFVEKEKQKRRTATGLAAAQTALNIVNAMGEGVILFRLNGTITTVNPAVERLTALRRQDLVGRNFRTVLPQLLEDEDLAMARRALDEIAQGGTPVFDLDHVVLKRKSGPPVVVSPAVTWIRSLDGTFDSAVLTLKDITELHRAGELLNQVFDNTHMQIVYLDTDFNFVRVNRAYAEACAHEPDYFSGKNHFDIFPHPENEAIFRRVRDTGEPFSVAEKAFEFPDHPERGVTYWDWSLRPISNEKGLVEGLLFCLLDVTDRVRARREQEEADKKYGELVENANNIIMRITPDHRILFFNEYAQKFFGYSIDEILGRSVVGTIVPPIDSEGRDLGKMMREITASPELYGVNNNENICKNGRRAWIHWTNRALRDEQGVVREILCVGTDMTLQRKLEKDADLYRIRLQRLTDRLTTTEEKERRRIATHIHDTVVQTLALSNIRLGGVMDALEKAGMGEGRETIAGIRKLLKQGAAECRGLMEELVPSLLYEVGLHAALCGFARKQAQIFGTSIRVEGDDGPKPIDDAVRGLLFQCARELIMNAEKYAGPCDILVSVSYADDFVQLRVQDNGRGFDPSEVDSQTHDRGEGGFGLFNIRERLEGMGGHLDIDSAPGKGTKATVGVPVGAYS